MMMEHHLNFDQKTFQVFLLIINNLINHHLNQLYQQIQSKFNLTNIKYIINTHIFCRPTSSWNAIVSAPRPRSTSPHSIPPSQDQRSDRSRSFNNKLSSNNERKSSNKKPTLHTTTKSPNRASKTTSQDDQQRSQSLTNSDVPINENNNQINDTKDDGFIQTKQQHRRLKRKHKIKEESTSFTDQSTIIESAPYALDDENAFPTLGQQQISLSTSNKKSENDSIPPALIQKSNQTYQICLTDMFNALSTSTQVKQQNSHHKISAITTINSGNTREQPKSRRPTKLKGIINKEHEDNQNQRQQSSSKITVEKQLDEKDIQNKTDTNTANALEE
jgi:hypothetical protein